MYVYLHSVPSIIYLFILEVYFFTSCIFTIVLLVMVAIPSAAADVTTAVWLWTPYMESNILIWNQQMDTCSWLSL